jgi:hypothetical protein
MSFYPEREPCDDDLITIREACVEIGGSKPISLPSYYRGAKAGIYPPPLHPSPGISRVFRGEVRKARDRQMGRGNT